MSNADPTFTQGSLFDLLRAPAQRQPVDGNGSVITGEPLETLILPHPRLAWHLARIELHPHEQLWMWSASSPVCGSYKVGPKWGRFAQSRDDAAHYAAGEILSGCDAMRRSKLPISSSGISEAQLGQIEAWAREIHEHPAGRCGRAASDAPAQEEG